MIRGQGQPSLLFVATLTTNRGTSVEMQFRLATSVLQSELFYLLPFLKKDTTFVSVFTLMRQNTPST
ncbi:hypothetical protein SZ66_22325 [Pantoea ananatis]|nr:hypothetical protein [Pantoea ananatis]